MFLINSRYPLVCATPQWLPTERYPFSRSYGVNLPSSFNTVLSSASVCSTSPPVSVSGTVYELGLFPGTPSQHPQSDQGIPLAAFVTSSRPRNVDLVPIDYGSRPRLRGRLTLRGLALRRNPWTFGVRVSRPHVATHVSILTSDTSRRPHGSPFTGLRNAPLPRQKPELRNQKTRTTWAAATNCAANPAACATARHTRRASAANFPGRCNPDRNNSAAIPASRRRRPPTSTETA